MLKKLTPIAVFVALTSVLYFTPAHSETLRLTHNTSGTTTWQKGAEKFNELLKENSANFWPRKPTVPTTSASFRTPSSLAATR